MPMKKFFTFLIQFHDLIALNFIKSNYAILFQKLSFYLFPIKGNSIMKIITVNDSTEKRIDGL
ncbi:hypothetical protein AB670_04065 [Chryseobacterium sp. MOF25P]|nr:hypothetical protein AB670_04065 [Chryseobacterium sp. MOF25P]OBW44290.1 hypothetical protein AB671_03491 [Chryseobacterium sp. BGARF1]